MAAGARTAAEDRDESTGERLPLISACCIGTPAYSPMRWARAEKKMPLGCSTAISATFA